MRDEVIPCAYITTSLNKLRVTEDSVKEVWGPGRNPIPHGLLFLCQALGLTILPRQQKATGFARG